MAISFEWIKESFNTEFACCAGKFDSIVLSDAEIKSTGDDKWRMPGVYIFLRTDDHTPVKVGKHNTDSFKRAKEHIRDNTGGIMQNLEKESKLELILINLKSESESRLHWIYAIEVYFELLLRKNYPSMIKAHRV